MPNTRALKDRIVTEIQAWPGIKTIPGDMQDEIAVMLGQRELGHLHGGHAAHFIGFSKGTWLELKEQGRITPHPMFPKTQGPASRLIEDEEDVTDVIRLFRILYDTAMASKSRDGVWRS
jgi:hypothetical protein